MKKASGWIIAAGGFTLQMLGLAGLADAYLASSGVFADVLVHYIALRDALFSIFPFSVPSVVKDYLIFGMGTAGVYVKACATFVLGFGEDKFPRILDEPVIVFEISIISIILTVLWPIIFLTIFMMSVLRVGSRKEHRPHDLSKVAIAALFRRNVFILLVVFIAILFVF